jgi:hypothetical protein
MVPLLELQRRQQIATLYFFSERPVIIEVFDSDSGSAPRMRRYENPVRFNPRLPVRSR